SKAENETGVAGTYSFIHLEQKGSKVYVKLLKYGSQVPVKYNQTGNSNYKYFLNYAPKNRSGHFEYLINFGQDSKGKYMEMALLTPPFDGSSFNDPVRFYNTSGNYSGDDMAGSNSSTDMNTSVSANLSKDNSHYYYIAKPKHHSSINIYETAFSYWESKKTGTIAADERFYVLAGKLKGTCRKVITKDGQRGWVKKDKITIIKNLSFFKNSKTISKSLLKKENLVLQKLRQNKAQTKKNFSGQFDYTIKIAENNGDSYILVEIESSADNSYKLRANSGIAGIFLPDNVDSYDNIKVTFFDDDDLYLDAYPIPANFDEYVYKVLNEISKYTTGVNFDKIKDIMELAGIGRLEDLTAAQKEILEKPQGYQFVSREYGRHLNALAKANPEAHKIQLAIKTEESRENLERKLKNNDLKIMMSVDILPFIIGRALLVFDRKTQNINDLLPASIEDFPFKITQNKYDINEIEEGVKAEFGDNYRIADWNDVVEYENRIKEFVDKLGGMKGNERNLWVTRNQNHFYDNLNRRHYYISFHNYNKPGHYLSHDNINNHYISLGSWWHKKPVLAIQKNALEQKPCNATEYNKGRKGLYKEKHFMGTKPGVVKINYQMYKIPDQIDVFYKGELVATTERPVSGKGLLEWNYNPSPGDPQYCIVRIKAPLDNTAWEYFIGCPE
ncbi:MAG: hypothetical protein ACOCQA_03560, partial [bacterium]